MMQKAETCDTLKVAHNVLDMGMRPVRLKRGEKRAFLDEWPDIVYDHATVDRDFIPGENVGILLGNNGGDFVDVDLDSALAIELAPELLPPTFTYGRASKPRSHWLYRCPGVTVTKLEWKFPEGRGHVELRANRHQTMFVGSIHPSGERVRTDPPAALIAEIPPAQLIAIVETLATRCGWKAPEAVEMKPRPSVASHVGRGDEYAQRLAELECATEGSRNDTLNRVTLRVRKLMNLGMAPDDALDQVRAIAERIGLGRSEIEKTTASAIRKADAEIAPGGQGRPWRAPTDGVATDEPQPMTDDELERLAFGWVEATVADLEGSQGERFTGIPVPGFPMLTEALDGLRGTVLFTGPSGLGKTTLVTEIACNVARGCGSDGSDPHPPIPVVIISAEMKREEVAMPMLSSRSGVGTATCMKGDGGAPTGQGIAGKLRLTDAIRGRVESVLGELKRLQDSRMLAVIEADALMQPWNRRYGRHALSGLQDAVHRLHPGRRVLVVIDTLATLDVQPSLGDGQYRSDLDRDADLVDALKRWRAELAATRSVVLSVHEESKAATGSGDGHSVRGSSKYLFSTTQRLNLMDASDDGSRDQGWRDAPEPGEDVTEMDVVVTKARRPGSRGTVVMLDHAWKTGSVTESGSLSVRDQRQRKAERAADRKGRRT